MTMKTCCPECETILTLNNEQLQQRNGMVRCGVCRQVFNATEHLYEEDYPVLSQEPDSPLTNTSALAKQYIHKAPYKASPASMQSIQANHFVETRESPDQRNAAHQDTGSMSYSEPSISSDTINVPSVSREPSLCDASTADTSNDKHYISYDNTDDSEDMVFSDEGYNEDSDETSRHSMAWMVLIVFAVLVLLVQLSYVFRNQISHVFPSARPYLVQMCGVFDCEVGIKKSIDNLLLENVILRGDASLLIKPGEQGLRLQAILKNKGKYFFQWPSLLLSLKNEQGAVVNSKIISPDIYLLPELRAQPFQANAQFPIDIPFTIVGDGIKNYELNIFYP